MDKFRRTNFYKTENVYGKIEKDLVNNNWDLFETRRNITFYTLTKEDIQRPDLVSAKIYKDIRYWWILSKYNKIDDWWNDVYAGLVINVPDVQDIEDWFLKIKSQQSQE